MPGEMSSNGRFQDHEYHADYPTADTIFVNQTNATLVTYWQRNGSGTGENATSGWQNVLLDWTNIWIKSEETVTGVTSVPLSGTYYDSWNEMSKSH
jgi:hypothetical protein